FTNFLSLSSFSSGKSGFTTQDPIAGATSLYVELSESKTASSPNCSIIVLVPGDQVETASTLPDVIAVTIAEASISVKVTSSSEIPASSIVNFNKVSLAVPVDTAIFFPFKSSGELTPFALLPINSSDLPK